jgi:hypothetical protein
MPATAAPARAHTVEDKEGRSERERENRIPPSVYQPRPRPAVPPYPVNELVIHRGTRRRA